MHIPRHKDQLAPRAVCGKLAGETAPGRWLAGQPINIPQNPKKCGPEWRLIPCSVGCVGEAGVQVRLRAQRTSRSSRFCCGRNRTTTLTSPMVTKRRSNGGQRRKLSNLDDMTHATDRGAQSTAVESQTHKLRALGRKWGGAGAARPRGMAGHVCYGGDCHSDRRDSPGCGRRPFSEYC